MPTHVALLRGINVGGRNRVAMADLREVVTSLGHTVSRNELSQVIADNPYPDETNPKCLHAVFRSEDMGPDEVAVVAAALQRAREKSSRDEAQVVGRTLFLRTPEGIELAAQLARPGGTLAADASSTTRNWATVGRLLALCDT